MGSGGGKLVRVLFWWCFVLSLASLCCSARHTTVSFSGNEIAMQGRSLMAVRTNDYNDPSANRGHDPRTRGGVGGRNKN
ncbi:hypothetical protein Sjap_001446 [Stephania japonica]|uniref:Uncharacterized protein n=1 Tax=Stephania japonica TaxID=461633 RepID=A0AAP0KK00_9MAGN